MSAQHGHYTPQVHEHADAWHHHAIDVEGVPQAEHAGKVNPFTVGKWFVLIVVSVIATCTVLYVYFMHYATQQKALQIETIQWSSDYIAYKAEMDMKLAGKADWINHDHLRIPVNEAMTKVVKNYQQKRSTAEAITK